MAAPGVTCWRAATWLCVAAAVAAQERADVRQRLALLPGLEPGPRAVALRAIADDVLFSTDAAECLEVEKLLRAHAAKGLFFSPSATQPSEAWFEYVRALRRLDVRRGGTGPDGLARTLQQLLARRAGIQRTFARLGRGNPTSVYDLTSFGWHGAGEVLEAVADLAARTGKPAQAVGAELAQYLECEQPHPLTPHPEGGATVGEESPDLPGRLFTITWLDGYRLALARAVLATEPPAADLEHAALHLLYSNRRDDRLDAITRLRRAPLSAAAVKHLAAQLGDGDRLVVREAIPALGAGGPEAAAAREALQRLAEGTDKELKAIAASAMRSLGTEK